MGPTIVLMAAFFLQSVFGQSSSSSSVDTCQLLAEVISVCEILTPSFTNLPASQQAGCVCASTLGTIPWGPASFDGLASSCAIAYAFVNPTVAYDASELSGLCTSYAVQGPSVVASSTPTPTAYNSASMSQVHGNSMKSTTGGLFSVSPGSNPTTVFSVVTAFHSATTNAAVRVQRQGRGVMELGLAVGGMAVGGYMMG